jgi:hypothetical protein
VQVGAADALVAAAMSAATPRAIAATKDATSLGPIGRLDVRRVAPDRTASADMIPTLGQSGTDVVA